MELKEVHDKSMEIGFMDAVKLTVNDETVIIGYKNNDDVVSVFSVIKVAKTFLCNHLLLHVIKINGIGGFVVLVFNEDEFNAMGFRRYYFNPIKQLDVILEQGGDV